MLRPLIAGNWKMNTTITGAVELVMSLRELLKGVDTTEVVLAPPAPFLQHLNHLIADCPLTLAAQNMHWESEGAYTGEVSARMLRDVGCRHVIIGHSERRQYFGETDETVNKKVGAALKGGLRPIVCVGETLEQRDAGSAVETVRGQLGRALDGHRGMAKNVTVAYEPVWAIGTGRTASAAQAEEVHNALREHLFETFERDAASAIRIIYGGSVKPANIDELMAQPNIDGALVGGASLNARDFARIVRFQAR